MNKEERVKGSQNANKETGNLSNLIAGGIAGAFSKTCTAPLARLTLLFQVQGMHSDIAILKNHGIFHESSRIIKEEGFRAFWKGNGAMVIHRVPYAAVTFCTFEHYRKIFQSILGVKNQSGSTIAGSVANFTAGGLAGMTASLAAYPLELVKTRLQAQRSVIYYGGIWHGLSTIAREEGVLGLYKGLCPTLLGVGPNLAINFAVYGFLKSFWQSQRPNDSKDFTHLICGSLSGLASSTVTFPLELVKKRIQLEGAGGRARVYNSGYLGTLRHIFRTEGLRGMYRGILLDYVKVGPTVAIIFLTYEKMKMFLPKFP